MAVEEAFAHEYITRLRVLRRMPTDDDVLDQLAVQFAAWVEDRDHAERTLERMFSEYDNWPGPASLRSVIEATRHGAVTDEDAPDVAEHKQWRLEYERDTLPWLCPLCHGYGLIVREDHLDRCSCEEGQPKYVNRKTGAVCYRDDRHAVPYMTDESIARWNKALKQKGSRLTIGSVAELMRMGPSDAAEPEITDTCPECNMRRGFGLIRGPLGPRPCICMPAERVASVAKAYGYAGMYWRYEKASGESPS